MNSNLNSDADYLWDKTGEPDPEVKQLEEILGTQRYQPRPLEIPAGLHVGRERSCSGSDCGLGCNAWNEVRSRWPRARRRLRRNQCLLRTKSKTHRSRSHRLTQNRNRSLSLRVTV